MGRDAIFDKTQKDNVQIFSPNDFLYGIVMLHSDKNRGKAEEKTTTKQQQQKTHICVCSLHLIHDNQASLTLCC